MFAVYANATGAEDSIRWSREIDRNAPDYWAGVPNSPALFDDGDLLVCGDDSGVYEFDNLCDPLNPNQPIDPPLLVDYSVDNCMSCTPGIGPNKEYIFWRESPPRMYLTVGNGSADYVWAEFPDADDPPWELSFPWYSGAPALDCWGRFYVATPGGPQADPEDLHQGRRIHGFQFIDFVGTAATWDDFFLDWSSDTDRSRGRYSPTPLAVFREFRGPVAVDEDGTLICADDRYVWALRPLLADFNGDGVVNLFDTDAFALALVYPDDWESTYGADYGLNLLGVGDGNNDGAFDHFDIDSIVDAIVAGMVRGGDDDGSESDGRGGQADIEYVCQVRAWLYEHFGMEDCR